MVPDSSNLKRTSVLVSTEEPTVELENRMILNSPDIINTGVAVLEDEVQCALNGFSPDELEITKIDGMISLKDIQYNGASDADPILNSLDIYVPLQAENSPVLIYVHGGGWRAGDKSNKMEYKPKFFTEKGYVFISLNYRLAPAVGFPAYVQDVACAIAWVYQNVPAFGGDSERLLLMGHSAGAHLVSLVSTDESYLAVYGLSLEVLKGTVSMDTASYDIPSLMEQAGFKLKQTYKAAFGVNPEVWENASPLIHISSNKEIPPFLLIYAGERIASERASKAMADVLRNAAIKVELYHAVNKNHITLNEGIGKSGDEPTRAIIEFLDMISAE